MRTAQFAFAALLCAAVAVAQDDPKSKTKVKVEDGKDLTVTGCVARAPGGGFTLTNVAGKKGTLGDYTLAVAGGHDAFDDLDDHVGHRVEIEGRAADQGKGKIEVETKSEGTSGKTESKSAVKGDLKGLPYLGVKSLRMIASVCP